MSPIKNKKANTANGKSVLTVKSKIPMGTKRKAKAFGFGKYIPQVPEEILAQAERAFIALKTKVKTEAKPALFGLEDEPVFLNFTLKKIPYYEATKLVRINVKHSFRPASTSTVCVIVPDESKKDRFISDIDKNARVFSDFLKFEKGVENIDLVVSLRQLEREYCTPEALDKLCSAYDVFIVDNRIVSQTSRRLSACFFKQNKAPFPLELRHGNVAARFDKCRAATQFCLYSCNPKSSVQVGVMSQTSEELVENIKCAVQSLSVKLPAGMNNIRRLEIVQANTLPPLDIFLSLDSGNTIQIGSVKSAEIVEDTLDTLPDGVQVKVDMNNLQVQVVGQKRRGLKFEKEVLDKMELEDTVQKKRRVIKKNEEQFKTKKEHNDIKTEAGEVKAGGKHKRGSKKAEKAEVESSSDTDTQ